MDFEPGTQFADRYRIIKIIGRGGVGTVLKAEDARFGRIVALKIFNQAAINKPEFARQVLREADVLRQLNHPSIIRLYDFGVYQDVPYLVMEYAERSLADVLREGKQRPEYAIGIITQVADALSYAHSKGIVHRDIKPSNILLASDNRILLSDFGLALPPGAPSLTDEGLVFGTPTYVSPEQAKGLPLDARSDIYSLAVVLFELLVGRPPFLGSSPTEIIAQHVEKPVPLELLRPLNAPQLENVLAKALAKEPGDRHATVEEFARDLRDTLHRSRPYNGGPEAVTPLTRRQVLPSARRAFSIRWVAVLGLGLLLALGGGIMLLQLDVSSYVSSAYTDIGRQLIAWFLFALVIASLIILRSTRKQSGKHQTETLAPHDASQALSSETRLSGDEAKTEVILWSGAGHETLQQPFSPLAWLVPINGPSAGQTFRLSDDKFTIGRGPECSLPLDDSAVSRNHAIVIFEDDRYCLYDLASSNGTFVNGERIMRHDLRDRDEIVIGQTHLIFKEVATVSDLTTDAQRRLWEFEVLWSEVERAVSYD